MVVFHHSSLPVQNVILKLRFYQLRSFEQLNRSQTPLVIDAMDYCLIRLSTQSNSDCRIGLSDFVSSVIEYSETFPEPPITLRVTSRWASNSFNRREIVVEDESTNFFKSENRTGLFFLSMTINMCNDFDFVNSSSKSSTPP